MNRKFMTQEEKQLLLQDISARLLYGVKVQVCNLKEYAPTVKGLLNDELYVQFDYIIKPIKNGDSTYNIINDNVKPYLRPMSSMTEEEKKELFDLCYFYVEEDWEGKKTEVYGIEIASRQDPNYCYDHDFRCWGVNMKSIDWLNAHHFDYRGLIEKGLALEVTEGMYDFNH